MAHTSFNVEINGLTAVDSMRLTHINYVGISTFYNYNCIDVVISQS